MPRTWPRSLGALTCRAHGLGFLSAHWSTCTRRQPSASRHTHGSSPVHLPFHPSARGRHTASIHRSPSCTRTSAVMCTRLGSLPVPLSARGFTTTHPIDNINNSTNNSSDRNNDSSNNGHNNIPNTITTHNNSINTNNPSPSIGERDTARTIIEELDREHTACTDVGGRDKGGTNTGSTGKGNQSVRQEFLRELHRLKGAGHPQHGYSDLLIKAYRHFKAASVSTSGTFRKRSRFILQQVWNNFVQNSTPGIHDCNVMITVHARCMEPDAALRLYEKLKESPTLAPDVITYNSLIKLYIETGHGDIGSFFNDMSQTGVQPTRRTFNLLIQACNQRRQQARRAPDAEGGPSDSQSDPPDGTSLVDTTPLQIVQKMMSLGEPFTPDASTYALLIDGFAKEGDTDAVRQVLSLMHESGHEVADTTRSSLIDASRSRGDVAGAEAAFKLLNDHDPSVAHYNQLLSVYLDFRLHRRTQALYDELLQQPQLVPDLVTLSLLLKMHAQRRDGAAALAVFNVVLEHYKPDQIVYNSLIFVLVQCNDFEAAEQQLQGMKSHNLKPDAVTWGTLVSGCVRRKEGERAIRYLRLMVAAGVTPNRRTIVEMQRYFLSTKDNVHLAEVLVQKRRLQHGSEGRARNRQAAA